MRHSMFGGRFLFTMLLSGGSDRDGPSFFVFVFVFVPNLTVFFQLTFAHLRVDSVLGTLGNTGSCFALR